MALSRAWSETYDGAAEQAAGIDEQIEIVLRDVRERLTDSHHLDILANPNTAALHVATDTDTEFPIHNAAGSKIWGFGDSIRRMRPGAVAAQDFTEEVFFTTGLVTPTIVTLATIPIADESVMGAEVIHVATPETTSTDQHIVKVINTARRTAAGSAVLASVSATRLIWDFRETSQICSVTIKSSIDVSGTNLLIRVGAQSGTINVVTTARIWRIAA